MIFFILELLLETGQVSLIEHPLLETYIELKWIKEQNTKIVFTRIVKKKFLFQIFENFCLTKNKLFLIKVFCSKLRPGKYSCFS